MDKLPTHEGEVLRAALAAANRPTTPIEKA